MCVFAAVVTTTWTKANAEPSGYFRFDLSPAYYYNDYIVHSLQAVALLIGLASLALVHKRLVRLERIVTRRIEQQIRA